jgi:tetratricopeptide (TPR) repeat protein
MLSTLATLALAAAVAQDAAVAGEPPLRALDARRAAIGSSPDAGAAAQLALELGAHTDVPAWYRAEVAALELRARGAASEAEARMWELRGACLAQIRAGSWSEAEALAREAFELAAELPPDRAVAVARQRMWLGESLHQLYRADEAIEHLAACRATWDELGALELGLYEGEALHVTDALARALDRATRHAEAAPLHVEFLAGTRRVFGEESREHATAINNYAVHLKTVGEIARAIPLFYEGLARKLELLEATHPSVGVAWLNLAKTLTDAGEPERAADAYTQALAIFDGAGATAALPAAMTRVLLAELFLRESDVESAERIGLTAEEARTLLSGQPPTLVKALLTHTVLLVENEELDRAADVLAEAHEVARDYYGPDHVQTAQVVLTLGLLHERRGELDRAAELYADCLRVHGESGLDEVTLSLVHRCLGRVHFVRGDLAAAEADLRRAADLTERERTQLPLGLRLGDALPAPLANLVTVRVSLGDGTGAWEAVERSQGRSLFELIARPEDDAHPDGAPDADTLRAEALRIEQRLAALDADEAATAHGDLRAELAARHAALRAELARAAAFDRQEPFRLERVQASLAADEALVGWLVAYEPDRTLVILAWCVRRDKPVRWFRRPLADVSELAPLSAFRAEVEAVARAPFPARPDGVDGIADELRELLFGELERAGALDGVAHLVVVPTSYVDAQPLDALVGDRWTVSFAPSASLFAWLREREPRPATIAGEPVVLALGDPTFSKGPAVPLVALATDAASPRLRAPVRSAVDGGLAALPGTRAEVAAVLAAFPAGRGLVGTAASEAELDRLAASGELAGFRVIHFATHALIDAARPGRSAIALSQRDLPDPLESALAGEPWTDGILTAEEVVARWRLDAELVVLSGCRTALGRRTESEGYLGLATAFLQTGARSLLVSLWDVDDDATMRFMESFYRHWRGAEARGPRTKAEALRRARSDLRAWSPDGERHPFAHPAYWAAFVLIGDPD